MIYFELFYVFFLIGLFTFGGGYAMIPMIQDEVVSRGWITIEELTNFIAISEATPGPFAINVATFIGSQTAPINVLGSICATLGVVLPSFIIILLVAIILRKVIEKPLFKGVLKGIHPVILALIASTVVLFFIKAIFFNGGALFSTSFSFDRASFGILIVLVLFYCLYKKINKKALNPLWLLGISAILGIIIFI